METRPVVYCRNKACPLHTRPQFETKNGACRRCDVIFFVPEVRIDPPQPPAPYVVDATNFDARQYVSGHKLDAFNGRGFPLALFAARTMVGMTQKQVAEKAGMMRHYISRVEKSTTPTLRSFERIAIAMGMTPYKLLLIYDFLTSPIGPIPEPADAASQGVVHV